MEYAERKRFSTGIQWLTLRTKAGRVREQRSERLQIKNEEEKNKDLMVGFNTYKT